MRSGEALVIGNVWTIGAIAAGSWGATVVCLLFAVAFFFLSHITE